MFWIRELLNVRRFSSWRVYIRTGAIHPQKRFSIIWKLSKPGEDYLQFVNEGNFTLFVQSNKFLGQLYTHGALLGSPLTSRHYLSEHYNLFFLSLK